MTYGSESECATHYTTVPHKSKHIAKAFDSVNYCKLFLKLFDSNIPHCLVLLLASWYSNKSVCIEWKCDFSVKFGIDNGTRQSSLLSPLLFNVYIADSLVKTH